MDAEEIVDATLEHDVEELEYWTRDMDDQALFLWLNKVWDFHALLTIEAMRRRGQE